MRACGNKMANELNPNARTDSAMSQIDAGGLSTVMALLASSEPHKNAFQLCDAA